MNTEPKDAEGLAALEAALAQDLAVLNYPPRSWVSGVVGPDTREVSDVLIVGAGMNGLCAAFALRRQGILRVRHIDAAPAGSEGPWLNYARMEYLRSPKHLTGPALGLPNLTFRAWWKAQFGENGWDQLGYIRRQDWARYLTWYAKVTETEVDNGVRLTGLRVQGDLIAADIEGADPSTTFFARQVVLATGREGFAVPRIPDAFAPFMGQGVQHSSQPLDTATLHGQKVAVVGMSASAFDNACTAAEAGADVTLMGRAPELPSVNKMKQTVYPGFAQGFPDLSDAERVAWLRYVVSCRTAPPRHTVQRAVRAGVRITLGIETRTVALDGVSLRLDTNQGPIDARHVILGTGFRFDLAAEPALGELADRVLLWRDLSDDIRATDDEFLNCPALGAGFEFRAKPDADPQGLSRIRCFNHAAQPSLGNLANDIPQASEGAERLARSIASALFVEDAAAHQAALEAFSDPELLGDEFDVS